MKKIYIICLKAPKLQIDKYKIFKEQNSVLSDFNELYFKLLPTLLESDLYNFKLYAWSTNKEYIKEFMNNHKKKYFYIKEIKLDKEDYNEFIYKNKEYRLEYIDYADDKNNDYNFNILSNDYEYDAVFNIENFSIETDVLTLAKIPYSIFEDDIIYALDGYLYTVMHELGEESDYMYDCYYGYYSTPYGRTGVTHRINGPSMYVRLFMMILK